MWTWVAGRQPAGYPAHPAPKTVDRRNPTRLRRQTELAARFRRHPGPRVALLDALLVESRHSSLLLSLQNGQKKSRSSYAF
jgi:hypothetical protein